MTIIVIPNAARMTARHLQISQSFQRLGHTVHYVQWSIPGGINRHSISYVLNCLLGRSYFDHGFPVYTFRQIPYLFPRLNRLLFQRQLRSLYQNIKADMIFSEGYISSVEVPADLPFIYDLADDYAGWAKYYGSSIHKLAFRYFDVKGSMRRQCQNALIVSAVSEKLLIYARQYAAAVHKLPNGVDMSIVNALSPVTTGRNSSALVYASGFGAWSRVRQLLNVVKKLRSTHSNLTLTLVGDGTEVPYITEFIRTNQASSYIFYKGFVDNQNELYDLIDQAAIGVNFCDINDWRDASHPMKIMDYAALGKIIVSTRLSELEHLPLQNMFLTDNDDTSVEDALVCALRRSSEHRGQHTVQPAVLHDYAWDVLVQGLLSLIHSYQKNRGNI